MALVWAQRRGENREGGSDKPAVSRETSTSTAPLPSGASAGGVQPPSALPASRVALGFVFQRLASIGLLVLDELQPGDAELRDTFKPILDSLSWEAFKMRQPPQE